VREAPAVHLCKELARAGIRVRAFDPAAMSEGQLALADYADWIEYAISAYEACESATLVVIMTEWNEFRALDLERLRCGLVRPVIVDARNVLDPRAVQRAGFIYWSTARDIVARKPETAPVVGIDDDPALVQQAATRPLDMVAARQDVV
jgi:UDPglucose 6-dehydrogenase